MPSQIFIYIIAIILFSFILLYGYNAIRDLTKKAEDVAYLKFVNNLDNAIRQNSGFGDVAIKQFSIAGYEKICFVDLNDAAIGHAPNTCLCKRSACTPNQDFDPIICNGWKDKTQRVFLTPPPPNLIDIWNITVDGDGDSFEDITNCNNYNCHYLCFDIATGKLNIRLDGEGDHVMVSRVD